MQVSKMKEIWSHLKLSVSINNIVVLFLNFKKLSNLEIMICGGAGVFSSTTYNKPEGVINL